MPIDASSTEEEDENEELKKKTDKLTILFLHSLSPWFITYVTLYADAYVCRLKSSLFDKIKFNNSSHTVNTVRERWIIKYS